MRGEHELRYRYISRTGPNDLFGNAWMAQHGWPVGSGMYKSSIGLAGPNGRRVQVEGYSVKGSDAAYAEQRLWLYPRFKVNEALSINSIISFSGNLNGVYSPHSPPIRDDVTSEYNIYISPSENWSTNPHYSGWTMLGSRDSSWGVPMAAPVIQALSARLGLPWGTVVYGRRPAGFGLGWVSHENDNMAESVSLIVPFGPVHLVWSQYLHETGEITDPNNYANIFGDYRRPLNTALGGFSNWAYTVPGAVDKNKSLDWNQAYAVIYRAGSLDMGAMARVLRWSNIHATSAIDVFAAGAFEGRPLNTLRDDAIVLTFASNPDPGLGMEPISQLLCMYAYSTAPGVYFPVYSDVFFLLGSTYLKHSTGRFSFNAEYDFQFIEVRRKGARPVSGFPQAWMVELSCCEGPMKLSAAHFYRSGHDRRRGTFMLANTPAYGGAIQAYDRWDLFLTARGGGQAPIEPYNFLMGLYGVGNNSYNYAGVCTYKDFLAYAARVDYALAANLNIFASFIRAERASNTGTSWGLYFGDSIYDKTAGEVPYVNGPNVPDNSLGWELDAGFQWRLIENLTFKLLWAYWAPGKWFKWAYQDYSNPIPGLFGGRINPLRSIDPLMAVQIGVLAEF